MRVFVSDGYGASLTAWRQLICRTASFAFCGCVVSGCAMSVPLPGFGSDTVPTGSIKTANPSPFASEMDAEDWRRAKSALDTALDPQGNGASVGWSNPQSGAKGSFTPLAQPFPKDDGICRAFAAVVELKGKDGRRLNSSACRRNGGEWIVVRIDPLERTGASKAGINLAERGDVSHLKD